MSPPVKIRIGQGITLGAGIVAGPTPYYLSGSSQPTDGSLSGTQNWSNGPEVPPGSGQGDTSSHGLAIGDTVRIYDLTGGSTFFYAGTITNIQYAGGFGLNFIINVTGSSGTANGSPSTTWKIERV